MLAAFGIFAALLHRERTGEGQEIEVSLLGSVMALQSFNITARLFGGDAPQRYPAAARRRSGTPTQEAMASTSRSRCCSTAAGARSARHRPAGARARRALLNFRERVRDNPQALIAILDEAFATRPADEWVES